MFETCKYCGSQIEIVNEKYGLVECLNCYLIFSRKFYSQEDLKQVYDHLYNDEIASYAKHSLVEYEQLKEGRIKIGYNRKRLLNKYLVSNSRILEIGSGVGLTGCFIRHNFTASSYTGIELDEEANKKARAFGLNVYQGDFRIMENWDKEYDVVLMWEVLEHIQDLKECLSLIIKKLAKDGVLMFSVPNYDKRKNYDIPGDNLFTSGPPVHLNFFRKKSIYSIFNSIDFEIVELIKKKYPYLNFKSFYKSFLRIMTGKYEGPTLYAIIRKK